MDKTRAVPCIFEYQDFRQYLRKVQTSPGPNRHTFSLRNWSKRLGYRSPRSIAMVLSGNRLPSPHMILALKHDLKWSADEKNYFELLVQKERNRRPDHTRHLQHEIERLSRPSLKERILDCSQLNSVKTPLHFILRQRLKVPIPIQCLSELKFELRENFAVEQIHGTVRDLTSSGLVREMEDRLDSPQLECYRTPEDIPSSLVQTLHLGFLDLAKSAIHQQGVLDREFIQLTFTMNENRTHEAKLHLRKLVDDFNRKFGADVDRQVFQLGIQLYRHTK